APGQVQVDLQFVARFRSGDEASGLDRQQVVLVHQPCDPLAVDRHAAPPQFGCHPAIAVAATVLQDDLVNRRTHLHVLLLGMTLGKKTIKSRPADPCQPAHRLDSQAAFVRHHFPDVLPDAVPPELLLLRRRASTLAKAALKKSNSKVFSTSRRFSRAICKRWSASRPLVDSCGWSSTPSSRSRQV